MPSGNPNIKPGPGRPKGNQNKTTVLLKDALLLAATEAGGGGSGGLVAYLKQQAIKNPGPFLAQLGKVLPLQITGADGGPVLIITGVQRLSDEVQERMGEETAVPMLTVKANDENR